MTILVYILFWSRCAAPERSNNMIDKEKFTEAFESLPPEVQEFFSNVAIGMAANHRENPNLEKSLRFYTLADLMPMFGVSYRTLMRWVKSGYLPTFKVGGQHRISEEDLLEFIKEKHIKTIDAI